MTTTQSDTLIAKAQSAADTHSRTLILAEADTWAYVSATWQVGWIKGYLAGQPTIQPISTVPRDGTWVLLFGPSGYSTTPLRAAVGRYTPSFRPHHPWQTHSNDAFTDGGAEPTHWMALPSLP